jgi:hypothetical protein
MMKHPFVRLVLVELEACFSVMAVVVGLVVVQPERECVIDLATAEYQRLLGRGFS